MSEQARPMNTLEAAVELTKIAAAKSSMHDHNTVAMWFTHFYHAASMSQLGSKSGTTTVAAEAAQTFVVKK